MVPFGIKVDASGNLYSVMTADFFLNFYTWTKSTGITSVMTIPRSRDRRLDESRDTKFGLKMGSNWFRFPMDVDASGNIYFAQINIGRIQLITKSTGIITTVAGTYATGFSGDGGSALLATLSPGEIALDASENIYISEYSSNRIRMVKKSTGIITTVAGDGTGVNSGDGGPATSARLEYPTSITVDSSGNIFICVGGFLDRRIRMVKKSSGIITTVAGGAGGYNDDRFHGSEGPATSASLTSCEFMAVDSRRNLYFADGLESRILMVKNTTGIITIAAGTGKKGYAGDGVQAELVSLDSVLGIAIDASDNIFIADGYKVRSFLLPEDTSHAYPTSAPITRPSMQPTVSSTTKAVSAKPSREPTVRRTKQPTTAKPSRVPTVRRTKQPTTAKPSREPTVRRTKQPTTAKPSRVPTVRRTKQPTTAKPSREPTVRRTKQPTTARPTKRPQASKKPFARKPSPSKPTTSPSMVAM
jgi:hypothetical protein